MFQVKNEIVVEKAVLVAVETQKQDRAHTTEYLKELEFLALTAGAEVKKSFIQRLEIPNPKTYVGTGKLNDVSEFIQKENIDVAIFDDELSPSQIRNLENTLSCRIIDRSTLILDIFARNARTTRAKTQVDLAQSQYLLPRLTRMWTHLEKQRGGIGMRGPGEKEIETDRRVIRDKISRLQKKLEAIDRQSVTQRKSRGNEIRIALVGYTNVGKSSLMNRLSKSDVLAENKLFATLDSTVRKVVIQDPQDPYAAPMVLLFSDTVGFIRKLPHQLIESFKSTLDEIKEADVLIHVVDLSHPAFEDQMAIVDDTLHEIGASDTAKILVFNKIDAYDPSPTSDDIFEDETIYTVEEFKKMWIAKRPEPVVFISALENTNINELRDRIAEVVKMHVRKR